MKKAFAESNRRDGIQIQGPTLSGHFFITDAANNVWCGHRWRGFGMAKMFASFREAFVDARRLKREEATTEAA